jgi:phosphate transport system permease protein
MASTTLIAEIMHRPADKGFFARLRGGDEISILLTGAATVSILLLVGIIVYQLWTNSLPAIHKFGFGFLTSQAWSANNDKFGALPFVFGTCVTSLIAMLLAVPFGVQAAIFLAEMAPPRFSNILTFLIELLAAVPSVIYGLLGIFILVPMIGKYLVPALRSTLGFLPFFQGEFSGGSFLSAGLILAVMIVPFIVSVSREVLLAVPTEQREAALALGATKWETTWDIVLPNASTGIMGSFFLALARALGETMAVTMVIGNTRHITASLFSPGYTIASVIANEFGDASGGTYPSSLIFLGLVLFGLTIVINALARIFIIMTQQRNS